LRGESDPALLDLLDGRLTAARVRLAG